MTEVCFTGEILRRRGQAFDIYEAIDAKGRKVAIKHARNLTGLDKPRFEREARLGRALRHAGLATVLDDTADRIVFEWLEVSRLGGAEEMTALGALRDIAQTLAHLHACGVVHRDMKPAHILFRGDRAVLIDLGVAGLIGSTDRLDIGEIVGSPAWMAPEQILGSVPAPSADIWSLCAVAHRMLNGRPLYAGTADAVLQARRAGPAAQPDFSLIADRHLMEMLHAGFAAPGDRPSAADLARALSKSSSGAP